MPVDYYPNKSIEELTAMLTTLQERQLKGTITQVSAAGVSTIRELGRNATMNARTETEIKRVLYSLFLRAAGTENAQDWPNPYASMIRRTRARYTFS